MTSTPVDVIEILHFFSFFIIKPVGNYLTSHPGNLYVRDEKLSNVYINIAICFYRVIRGMQCVENASSGRKRCVAMDPSSQFTEN